MAEDKYRQLWWQITLTKILFSVIPLILLALVLYNHFSDSYTSKVLRPLGHWRSTGRVP
jgi:hypothetical protein